MTSGQAATEDQVAAIALAGSDATDALGVSTASNLGASAAYDPATNTISGLAIGVGGTDYDNVEEAVEAADAKADTGLGSVAAALGGTAVYDPATGAISGQSFTVAGTNQTNITDAFTALDAANTNANNGLAQALGGGASIAADGTVTQPVYQVNGQAQTGVESAINALDTAVQSAAAGFNLTTGAVGSGQSNGATNEGIAAGEQVTLNAGNNLVVDQNANEITFSLADDITADSVTADTVTAGSVTADTLTINGGPSLSSSGIDMNGRSISNLQSVLGGQQATEFTAQDDEWNAAVTVGDLASVQSDSQQTAEQTNNQNDVIGGDEFINDDGTLTQAGSDALKTNDSNVNQLKSNDSLIESLRSINLDGTIFVQTNSTQGVDARALATGDDAIAIGSGAVASGNQSISIGTGNVVSGNNSGAIGDPNTVSGNGSYALGNNNTIESDNAFVVGNDVTVAAGNDGAVVLGNGSTVGAANTGAYSIDGSAVAAAPTASTQVVSVGSAGGERQVQNVAAGTVSETSTDAINGSQLFATNAAILNLEQNTRAAFGELDNRVNQNRRDADAGIAGAMALGTLPQPTLPGMSGVSGGLSTFQGQGAVAVGVSAVLPSNRWVIKGGVSADTQGQGGAAVGALYQW